MGPCHPDESGSGVERICIYVRLLAQQKGCVRVNLVAGETGWPVRQEVQ